MGTLMNSSRARVMAAIVAAVVVVGGVGAAMWSGSAANRAASTYRAKRQALDASISAAGQQGYTRADLAPVTSQVGVLDVAQQPWFVLGQPGYYDGLTSRTTRLQSQLASLEQGLMDQARGDASRQTDAAKAAITQDQQANASDPDVQGLQQRMDAVARAQGAAHVLKDYRAAAEQAQSVARDATALFDRTQQENQAIQQAAQQLVAQNGGNLAAIQAAGNQAMATANNSASIVSYLGKEMQVKGGDAVARAYSRLTKYAGLIGSGDVNQAAQGAAAAQTYAGQIHAAMVAGLPSKAVIVSFQDQHLWAYENNQVVKETPVTTGIWGNNDIGTDFGPMKVLWKSHPWTMHSPWPATSPFYYKDTVVQWTTFFTNTGESIHDAKWEPDSLLGPGSQYNLSTRSHGCVHVPLGTAEWMFNWANVGMPVIVYPGDGSAVANQMSKITTDDAGNPKSIPH
jgi:hypothetical protein